MSNALAEAMAWGCPVFATDVGGTAEVIRNGENGFLLSPLYSQDWVDKLELARDRPLMERIREAAYETACRLFAPEAHAKQFRRFYKKSTNMYCTSDINQYNLDKINIDGCTEKSFFFRTSICEILLWGKWEWHYNLDLCIKEIIPLLQKKDTTQCAIVGNGPQEDELGYLVSFFDVRNL